MITITSNKSDRTFTIRELKKGTLIGKYRTIRLPKKTWETMNEWEIPDWMIWLKLDGGKSYYEVKMKKLPSATLSGGGNSKDILDGRRGAPRG